MHNWPILVIQVVSLSTQTPGLVTISNVTIKCEYLSSDCQESSFQNQMGIFQENTDVARYFDRKVRIAWYQR